MGSKQYWQLFKPLCYAGKEAEKTQSQRNLVDFASSRGLCAYFDMSIGCAEGSTGFPRRYQGGGPGRLTGFGFRVYGLGFRV